MRINETGKDVLAARVNELRPGRRRDIRLDARNGLVGAEDVGDLAFCGGDDFAILDEQSHASLVNPACELGQQEKLIALNPCCSLADACLE